MRCFIFILGSITQNISFILGMSQYQAAKLYNIPKATMWRYANALNKSSRKSNTKQDDEEEQHQRIDT